MGVQLGDLGQVFDPYMEFTAAGRVFRIPPASAELGLWARAMFARVGAADLSEDSTEEQVAAGAAAIRDSGLSQRPPGDDDATDHERLLGRELVAEMAAAGLPDPAVQFVFQVAMVRVVSGDDAAALYFASGGRPPERGPANRQERRAASTRRASASKTTSTGAAGTTRTPGSGRATKSQPTSAKPAKATPSRGRKS